MRRSLSIIVGMGGLSLLLTSPALAEQCAPDSVQVGATCVDTYEASVWEIPNTPQNRNLIKHVRRGRGTLERLQSAAGNGVVQRGLDAADYPCSPNGNDCTDIYAVSIPMVLPSARITWFQAQQACGNSGKRLLRNGEWQQAAAGTPDPGTDNGSTDCNIVTANDRVPTGSRSECKSRWGAFDMVGNVVEWVEDWLQDNSDIDGGDVSTATFGNDLIRGIDEAGTEEGIEADRFPAALLRGGNFDDGTEAGVFALHAIDGPSRARGRGLGFRCGR